LALEALAAPALQGARARFDALHRGGAGQGGDFGEADEGVGEVGGAGGDVGGLELVLTGEVGSVSWGCEGLGVRGECWEKGGGIEGRGEWHGSKGRRYGRT